VTQSLTPACVCYSLLLILVLFVPAGAQRSDIVSASISPAPYRVGERLTYNVSFSNFISAAHVELQVLARGTFFGREGIQIAAQVKTSGVVSAALYSLDNDYFTYVDPNTGIPFRTQRRIREAMRASESTRDLNSDTVTDSRSGSIPGTYDFVSALYRLRALPLAEGSTYSFVVQGDTEQYQAELRITGRQTLKVNVGTFNTLVGQVRVRNNSRANSYNLRVYFSDDVRHIPVLITAKHRAGEIRAELAASDFAQPAVTTPAPPTNAVAHPPSGTTLPTTPSTTAAELPGLPFKVGEQLNYQIYLANVMEVAGTATYHVRARSRYFDREGLLIVLRAQTTNAMQRLFFANDQITSYVDPQTLLPFRSELDLTEGRRRLNQIITINQDHGTAVTDNGTRMEIPVGTHDILSCFYALRTFNLTPPRRNAISLLVEGKTKTLFITALQRETIQLGTQQIPAIQVSLTTDDPDSDKFKFRGWISDDSRRLPLRLTAMSPLGQVRADLAIIPLAQQ